MLLLLTILFVAGAIVMFGVIVVGTVNFAHVMPAGCPKCHRGNDENLAGQHRFWYVAVDNVGGVECRHCGTLFKEHPNGLLVEDR